MGSAKAQRKIPEVHRIRWPRNTHGRKDHQIMKRSLFITGALLALLPAAMPGAFAISAASHPKPRITAAQARRVALKKYPHARADARVPLENEDGKSQYSVTVHQKTRGGEVTHEVMVGAMSGKIESEEVTTPAEEAREAAGEHKAARSRNHTAK
jgi:uncharacterized membrane protein YkoI